MPDNTTSNELANELADRLIYSTSESEKWLEMLGEENPDPKRIRERLSSITWAGSKAGLSEGLAHVVGLRYAVSVKATLTTEEVAATVSRPYAYMKSAQEEETAKKAAKTAPDPKKTVR